MKYLCHHYAEAKDVPCLRCADDAERSEKIRQEVLRAVRDALLALDSTDIPGTGIEVIYERDIEALFRRGGPFEVIADVRRCEMDLTKAFQMVKSAINGITIPEGRINLPNWVIDAIEQTAYKKMRDALVDYRECPDCRVVILRVEGVYAVGEQITG